MKQFVKFYRQLLIANVSRTLAHRVDFLNSIFSTILWGAFSILAIFVITAKSTQVAGWTKGEVILLALTYAIIVGFFHLFFSRNFPTAATLIHHGELDGLLLKPMNSLFLLIAGELNYAQIIRSVITVFLIWKTVLYYDLHVTFVSIILFCLLTIAGVAILVAIHILFTTLLLYHSYLSNIMEFGSLLVSASRYPMDSLRYVPIYASLVFLPVMAAVNIPTKALIGKASTQDMIIFSLGSGALLWFSLWIWKKSLSHYTGASG